MKRFPVLLAFVLVTGSELRPAYPHTSAAATAVAATTKSYAEDSETTCDPLAASSASVAGSHDKVYGDCGTAPVRSAAARRQDSSLWPRSQDVYRPPRWRRHGRSSRLYGGGGGLQRLVATPRHTAVVHSGDDDVGSVRARRLVGGGARRDTSLEAQHTVAVRRHHEQPRTSMKTTGKMLLYALGMFFEQMELTVYVSLYKIKLLYNTLIAPMINSW